MLRLPVRLDLAPPPLLLAAVGPRTVELAGRHFDGVILHPLLTPDAVARSTARMRAAAEAAGRDPDGLRCIATVLTAVEVAPEDEDEAIRARAAGYLSVPGLGDAIARANDWDEGELARYRAQPALVGLGQLPADKHLSRPQLIELAATLPSGWLAAGAITGDAQTGAARLHEYTAAGADEVILHGTVGDALAPLVRHLAGRGAHLT
jgi:alkanesulfonate monooxygenase SsuD/methylene tetrahydromethanopterin reductase-like flavin-dependent oxidoreductase (luciferase family)